MIDVNRASQNTLSSIQGESQALSSSSKFEFKSFSEDMAKDGVVVEGDEADLARDGSDRRKVRWID